MISLEDKFPQLAQEWDYDKNDGLKPSELPYGSHKEVYWVCPACKQSYKKRICNRTAPAKANTESRKCPICLGRQIIPGYNSLMAKYPEVVANEWDYSKNTVDPDTIPPHTNKKYWWKCSNGHSYEAKPNNKINDNGGNCPYCSHQKLCVENSLWNKFPEISQEWDFEANYPLTPKDVAAYSNKKVNWICNTCGHKWVAAIDNRTNGKGCPSCSKGQHTSFPEQAIFHYVKSLFPDARNGEKIHGYEIDIFIPELKIGIEYDGEYYHRNRIEKDIKKNSVLHSKGIKLIRIRESGCPTLTDGLSTIYTIQYSPSYESLELILREVLESLCSIAGIEYSITINLESLKTEILSDIYTIKYEDSFEYLYKEKAASNIPIRAIWDTKRNFPLMPHMVQPFSEKEVWWICPKNHNHIWKNTIKSVSLGYGCAKCSKKHHYTTSEWIEAATSIHDGKYYYHKVNYINAKTPVIITCKKHGDFKQNPSEHLAGKGCKYCAKQAFHPTESLQHLYPDIASEWDYDLNKESGFTPETIGIDTKHKFWWHCTNGKSHSFQATIAKRVSGTKCAICHGKQVSYDTSIEYLYPELMKEWSENNEIAPSGITRGSEKKVWWKCPINSHPEYLASPYSRIHLKTGCPICGKIKSQQSRKK